MSTFFTPITHPGEGLKAWEERIELMPDTAGICWVVPFLLLFDGFKVEGPCVGFITYVENLIITRVPKRSLELVPGTSLRIRQRSGVIGSSPRVLCAITTSRRGSLYAGIGAV